MKAGEKISKVSGTTRENKHPATRLELSRRDFIKTSSAVSLAGFLLGTDYVFARGAGGSASQARGKFGLAVLLHRLRYFGSKDEVKDHVERLADAGVDILIPIVKDTNGDVDFLTSLADIHPEYPDWDPLKVLIENCQKRGIKVLPEFCVFTEGERSRLLRTHPEFKAEGFEGSQEWACAMHPEVRDYEFGLYRSLALRYRPDGLHLDFIRTGGVCTCKFCSAEMKKQGIDIKKVKRANPTWTEWRASRVTQFVRYLRKFTKKEKMKLSASVCCFRNYESARVNQSQDWVSWAQEQLLDYLKPMNYTNDLSDFTHQTKSHVALVRGRVPVWEGLNATRLSTEALAKHAQAARDAGAQGVAIIYNHHAITDDDFKALREVRERAGDGG